MKPYNAIQNDVINISLMMSLGQVFDSESR